MGRLSAGDFLIEQVGERVGDLTSIEILSCLTLHSGAEPSGTDVRNWPASAERGGSSRGSVYDVGERTGKLFYAR